MKEKFNYVVLMLINCLLALFVGYIGIALLAGCGFNFAAWSETANVGFAVIVSIMVNLTFKARK